MPDARPRVLFVCRRNAGKSQMAAALLREMAGDSLEVRSAGTEPGDGLNAQSVASLEEVGAPVGDEHPKPLTAEMTAWADVIVVLGAEARVEPVDGTAIETWITDEPSARGIEGMERMRIVRDDILGRVADLRLRLLGRP